MPDFPINPIEPLVTIHPWSMEAIGPDLTASGLYYSACASAAWQIANAAFLVPFTLTKQYTATTGFWYNGATVTYNVDVGVYDISGNMLCHTGSVVSSGTSVLQTAALTASTSFGPGNFYLAITASDTSMTFFALAAASVTMLRAYGCVYIPASDLPLATGKTLTAMATFTRIPIFGISSRSTI